MKPRSLPRLVITLSDVETSIGIKTLNINMADQDGSAIVVDLEAAKTITVGGADLVEIADSEADVSTYYSGSITLGGDDANTVTIGATQTLLDTALPTPGSDSVYGSWSVTTGAGGDTITGSGC